MKSWKSSLALAAMALVVAAAAFAQAPAPAPATGKDQAPPAKHYKLKGTVKSVEQSDHKLVVAQGEIPGFMGAMTMPYNVKQTEDLSKVSAGDQITADVVVTEKEAHLENVKVTGHAQEKGK